MTTTLFQITAAEIEDMLNPSDEARRFQIGDGLDMTEAQAIAIAQAQEDHVVGYIPSKYRELLRRVYDKAEVVVDYATESQTSAQLALWPVTTNTLKLYRNYGRNWRDRTAEDEVDPDLYTFEETDGSLELDPTLLEQGDTLYATYEHTAMTRCAWLREKVLIWTACEIAKRFNFFRNADANAERFAQWSAETREALIDLKYGRVSIDLFDDLKTIANTQRRDAQDSPSVKPFLW